MPPPLAHLLDRPERRDRAVPDRERRVGDQQLGVEVVADAQAVARRAHPLRAVEAEELRAGRVEAQPAGRAGVVRREQEVGLPLGRDDDRPLAELQRLLDRLGQPPALRGPQRRHRLEPVDDDLDVVLDLPVERQVVGQVDDLAVDPRPHVAGPGQLGEEVLVFPLLAADHRGQHQERRPGGQLLEDPRDDLLAGLGRHRPAAVRAVPLPDPGKEHPQVVVDLGDRADRRPRVPPAGLLLDRDRRAEPVDPVDLGLGHLAQELPGVAREALDIPPLALGIERVKRQRALARARDAGQADQLAPRQHQRHVAEVVLASPPDHDVRCHPCAALSQVATLLISPATVKRIVYTCCHRRVHAGVDSSAAGYSTGFWRRSATFPSLV